LDGREFPVWRRHDLDLAGRPASLIGRNVRRRCARRIQDRRPPRWRSRNDLLEGGGGNDTYVLGRDYGRDIINDSNNSLIGNAPDRLVFNEGVVVSISNSFASGSTTS